MIKTKYVVGDVVVVNGKQKIIAVVTGDRFSLYEQPYVWYQFTDGSSIDEGDIDASN